MMDGFRNGLHVVSSEIGRAPSCYEPIGQQVTLRSAEASWWDRECMDDEQRTEAVRQDELMGMETPALNDFRSRAWVAKALDWSSTAIVATLLAVLMVVLGWQLGEWFMSWIHSGAWNQ